MSLIPIVILAYNNITFVKKFINQIYNLTNEIIIVDNCSTYSKQHEWYNSVNDPKIKIIIMNYNYGHNVIYTHKTQLGLPNIFVLSDPDLELNCNMPANVIDILVDISNKYKVRRVGLSLSIDDSEEFIEGEYRNLVVNTITQYKSNPTFIYKNYSLKEYPVDTTFALHNFNYEDIFNKNICILDNFECKHLPWYKNYLINNIPKDELREWIHNNKSSSILQYIGNDINNYLNN